jgi:predicted SAM-dependent methyltransferase
MFPNSYDTIKSRIGSKVLPLLPMNRRTFDILRHELNAVRTRITNTVNPFYHLRVRRLRLRQDLSLNLGSGGKGQSGWINIELIKHRDTTLCLDIRRPLPFADNSVIRILAEHVVEHIDFRHDLPIALSDWHRVLRPGGIVRIVVPDARRFLEAYVSGDSTLWRSLGWYPLPDDIYSPMHAINHIFHQSGEHLFAYDFETLAIALNRVGFKKIEEMSFRKSHDQELAIDQANHAPHSLYVEAIK